VENAEADNTVYEIITVDPVAVTPNTENRYLFNFDGITQPDETAQSIVIGQVKFSGYGTYSFGVDASIDGNIANAAKAADNLVDTFVTTGETGKGVLDISSNVTGEIKVPVRELTINIKFPNTVEYQAADYQDMTVTVVGGTVDNEYNLGNKAEDYTITEELPYNTTYTVTVSGAGYRTARYSVTLTEDKTLNFWNNVMDNAIEVEDGKDTSAVVKNFLAGDIVKDNNINIYDLSAVVSYFGSENCVADHPEYAKYDLNRDGVIDSKDVAYVLVSWGE